MASIVTIAGVIAGWFNVACFGAEDVSGLTLYNVHIVVIVLLFVDLILVDRRVAGDNEVFAVRGMNKHHRLGQTAAP